MGDADLSIVQKNIEGEYIKQKDAISTFSPYQLLFLARRNLVDITLFDNIYEYRIVSFSLNGTLPSYPANSKVVVNADT